MCGTSARLALLEARGDLPRGSELIHHSIVGTIFSGWVTGDAEAGGDEAQRLAVVERLERLLGRALRGQQRHAQLDGEAAVARVAPAAEQLVDRIDGEYARLQEALAALRAPP